MTTLLDDLLEAKEEAESDFSPGILSAVATNQTRHSDSGQAQCRAGVGSSVHLFICSSYLCYILLWQVWSCMSSVLEPGIKYIEKPGDVYSSLMPYLYKAVFHGGVRSMWSSVMEVT